MSLNIGQGTLVSASGDQVNNTSPRSRIRAVIKGGSSDMMEVVYDCEGCRITVESLFCTEPGRAGSTAVLGLPCLDNGSVADGT